MNKELFLARLERQFEEFYEEFKSTRLRSPRPACDVDGFFTLVGKVIEKQQELDGASTRLIYSEEYPEQDDNIEGERITFSVRSRRPGTFEQVQVGLADADRRIRSRMRLQREILPDPDNPGMKIFTYGQEYDNWVTFRIWAKTNKVANKRAMWFENLIDEWRWYFEASGVKRVLYDERMEDVHISPDNRKLVCRPLSYFVRTEKVSTTKEFTLRSLIAEGSLG